MPVRNVPPEAGAHVTVSVPSTMSVDVGSVYVTFAPLGLVASTLTFACAEITGGVVSRTITLKVRVATLPAASRAVQVTTVVPSAKSVPDAGEHVTATLPSTRSVAAGRL